MDRRSQACRQCRNSIGDIKKCPKCRKPKPISDYRLRSLDKHRPAGQRPRGWCKACRSKAGKEQWRSRSVAWREWRNAKRRKHKQDNPVKHAQQSARAAIRRWVRKGVLGIENIDLLAASNVCAICGSSKANSRDRRLHVDHCHKTMKFRGLLCSSCNTALGQFKDNVELLRKAIKYLLKKR